MTVQLIINNKEAILNFTDKGENIRSASFLLQEIKEKHIDKVYAQTDAAQFSSLLASELYALYQAFVSEGIKIDYSRLKKNERDMLSLSLNIINIPPAIKNVKKSFLEIVGEAGYRGWKQFCVVLKFISETFSSVFRFCCGKAVYRKRDFWFTFEDCSYRAIGITALVSFLVGLILAFVGALQLKSFGAEIYVSSMVALGMTRIMAAIMVGIIMAGRTGSSFAATIGTMQVNEEIDALKTFGIKISDFLIAPRLISLVVTIPFLTLLADVLGILGGAVIGINFLGISSTSYFDYSIKALNLNNILVGLLHSFIYGIIISICGCYEGLTAGRDADAVGKATTNAVVTALVWMIVATGILTVILEVVGI